MRSYLKFMAVCVGAIAFTVLSLSWITGQVPPVGVAPDHQVVYRGEAGNGWLRIQIDGVTYVIHLENLVRSSQ